VQDPDALAVYDVLAALRTVAAWPPAAAGGSWRHYFSGTRIALVAATEGHFAGVATWQRLRLTYPWIGVNAQVLPVTAPVTELCAMLERLDPAAIASYPTTLRVLAAEQLAGRVRLSPSVLWSGGEWCSPAVRSAVQRAFGCPILDDYGASEFMNIAHQCREGALHVNADWVLLEPVDEKLRPVPPGTTSASVLLTNLANRVQPLIRYDLGDSVTFSPRPCACGSPFPAIQVEGRRDDILSLRSPRKRPVQLLPMGLATVIEEEALVHRFQVVQTGADCLEVRLEPSRERSARSQEARVKKVLGAYLARHGCPKATLIVRRMHIAADEPSGKFRQVWRED
jgi:phenylacetate-coenzyme A ligase PaaK-like adenylate-forming protein